MFGRIQSSQRLTGGSIGPGDPPSGSVVIGSIAGSSRLVELAASVPEDPAGAVETGVAADTRFAFLRFGVVVRAVLGDTAAAMSSELEGTDSASDDDDDPASSLRMDATPLPVVRFSDDPAAPFSFFRGLRRGLPGVGAASAGPAAGMRFVDGSTAVVATVAASTAVGDTVADCIDVAAVVGGRANAAWLPRCGAVYCRSMRGRSAFMKRAPLLSLCSAFAGSGRGGAGSDPTGVAKPSHCRASSMICRRRASRSVSGGTIWSELSTVGLVVRPNLGAG